MPDHNAKPILVFALAIACFMFLFSTQRAILDNVKESDTSETVINMPISQHTAGTSSSSLIGRSQCMNSEEEIDGLFSQLGNHATIITMPAKSAGSSMKAFVEECTKSTLTDNFLNDGEEDIVNLLVRGGLEGLHPPKLIASHIYRAEVLTKLVTNVRSEVLLIYIHRNENERLKSALKEVIKSRRGLFCNVRYDEKNGTCILTEDKLIEPIRARFHEIGFSQATLLTCEVYEAIERNSPNMLFMSFEEADRLQRLLSKKYCPDIDHLFHSNTDGEKRLHPQVQIQEHPEEVLVDLDEWINLKEDFISFAFELQNQKGCQSQGISREMEKKLQECPTRFMKVPSFVY